MTQTDQRIQADAFLDEVLSSGPVKVADILNEAKAAGISEISIKRAKANRVGTDREIVAERVTEGNRGTGFWVWKLKRLIPLREHDNEAAPVRVSTLAKLVIVEDDPSESEILDFDMIPLREEVNEAIPARVSKLIIVDDDSEEVDMIPLQEAGNEAVPVRVSSEEDCVHCRALLPGRKCPRHTAPVGLECFRCEALARQGFTKPCAEHRSALGA